MKGENPAGSIKLLVLLVLQFCMCVPLFSQDSGQAHIIDSLKKVLAGAKRDTVRCNALNGMIEAETDDNVWPAYNEQLRAICETNLKKHPEGSQLYDFYLRRMANALNNEAYLANLHGEIPKALEYFQKALKMEEQSGNKNGIASSLNNLGSVYRQQGAITKALECFERSLALRGEIKDQAGMAETLTSIGLIYDEQGDIPKALDYYVRSLKLQEAISDKHGMAITLNNLGSIYLLQGDLARALSYYQESLKIEQKLNEKDILAGAYHNIANIYEKQGNTPLAIEYLNKSYALGEETGNLAAMAHCLNSLGAIYKSGGDGAKALEHWYKSLALWEKVNDKQGISMLCNHIAVELLSKGKVREAEKFGLRSLALAQELGFPGRIQDASRTLSGIYTKTGNWKGAYDMHVLYKHMSDSILNQSSRKTALQKAFQYQYEKKAVADSIHAIEERKVFEAELRQQKTQRTALYVGIALTALFALFMYNRFRLTNKQKHIIEQQEKETQHQKNIIEEKHREISDSINYAERIQRSFLASEELLDQHLKEYFVLFKPRNVVSGDFYWASELRNGHFAFVTADSTGHGVPGAIMSILNISSLERAVADGLSEPSEILNATRRTIIERLKKDGSAEGGKDGMDASLICFDLAKQTFTYAAANNPVLVVQGDKLIELPADKMPVGKFDRDELPFTQHQFQLQKGDVIYSLTDGLPDQFGGPKGKKFMYRQLKELLLSIAKEPMAVQKQKLEHAFEGWKGGLEQVDDVCLIGVRMA